MSYCRTSSDNFKSNIYMYSTGKYYIISIAHSKGMLRKKLISITLPYAGETFYFNELKNCKVFLLYLREFGYHIPESALKRINKELDHNET